MHVHVHACEEPLITGDVFSTATISKTGIKPKMLYIQEKVDIVNSVRCLNVSSQIKSLSSLAFLCQMKI